MSSAHFEISLPGTVPPDSAGSTFVRRGLRLFVFGLVIVYDPKARYLHEAMEEVQPAFLKSVTLWWGCHGRLQSTPPSSEASPMEGRGLARAHFDEKSAVRWVDQPKQS